MTAGQFVWTNKKPVSEAAEKGVARAAQEVRRDAVMVAPVRTGRLKQSILDEKVELGHHRVGTNVVYAPFVEFGTRFMSARPFLGPALEKARSKYGSKFG